MRRKHFFLLLLLMSGMEGCRNDTSTPPIEPKVKRAPVSHEVAPTETRFGVLVSIDGLGALYLKPMWENGRLPGLSRLAELGAYTNDARTDPSNTRTLPNHTCMLTGLPVGRPTAVSNAYHGFTFNQHPPPRMTLHSANPNHRYLPSIFDVAHDFGKKTCLFSGKSRFVIFDRSYDEQHGAMDAVAPDHGRDKIDVTVISEDLDDLFSRFADIMMSESPCHLTFFHIADPDRVGHAHGWGGYEWREAVTAADEVVSKMLGMMSNEARFKGHSALLVTADHGGHGIHHGNPRLEAVFTIPFYVMAPRIPANTNLYSVVSKTRRRWPGHNPSSAVSPQPIRNGDAGNLLLALLGLPPVPGSVMFGMLR